MVPQYSAATSGQARGHPHKVPTAKKSGNSYFPQPGSESDFQTLRSPPVPIPISHPTQRCGLPKPCPGLPGLSTQLLREMAYYSGRIPNCLAQGKGPLRKF